MQVAEVEQLQRPSSSVSVDLVDADHDLDAAGLVPEFEELQLARRCGGGRPGRRRGPSARAWRRRTARPGSSRIVADRRGVVEPLAPRVDAEGLDLAELLQPDLGVVVRGSVGRRAADGRHGSSLCTGCRGRKCHFTDAGTPAGGSLEVPRPGTVHCARLQPGRDAMTTAADRLASEQLFHDRQAADRAATFRRDPAGLLFADDDYLDHETWVRPAFDKLGDLRGKRVLDYGCGHGMAAVVLARRGAAVTAFDLSPGYVREAGERAAANGVAVRFVVADGEHLPFADALVRRGLGQRDPAPPRPGEGRGRVAARAEARRGGGVLRAVGRQPAAGVRPPPPAVPRQGPHARRAAADRDATSPRSASTSPACRWTASSSSAWSGGCGGTAGSASFSTPPTGDCCGRPRPSETGAGMWY